MENKEVVIINSDDWEALYIDGISVDQGHEIGEGDRLFLLKMAEEYNFKSSDIREAYISEEDNKEAMITGEFPKKLSDFKSEY